MGGDIRFHCSWWLSHHLAYPLGRQRPVIHVFSMCSMDQDKTVPMLNLAHYDMFPYLWRSVVAFTLSWHSSFPSSNWHPLPQICRYSCQLKVEKMVPFLFFLRAKNIHLDWQFLALRIANNPARTLLCVPWWSSPINTSLCFISLFSGCWNVAYDYGGDPY